MSQQEPTLPKDPEHRDARIDSGLFELFMQSVTDYAMFVLDPKGYILTWNEGARRIKGYEAHDIIGQHFSVFYPPVEIQRRKPDFELAAAAADGRFEDEGWRVRKDGSRFWANVIITALYREGRLVGFAKVTRDLTERHRAEEERSKLLELERKAREQAEASLERLHTLQQVTEAALSSVSTQATLQHLLDAIVDALPVDTAAILLLEQNQLVPRAARGLEEEVSQGVRIPLGQGFAGRVASERKPMLIADVQHSEVINPILREQGLRMVLGVPLLVEGRIIGVLHVGSRVERHFNADDVTLLQMVGDRAALTIDRARRVDAEQAAHAQRESAEALVAERDRFISVAAHELKTPITSLSALAQLLDRRLYRPGISLDDVRGSAQTIARQATKLAQLVNQLMEVTRLETGKLAVERQSHDLSALAAEVVDVMRAQRADRDITFDAEPGLYASVDALRIEQVITNLLDNAIKFSPDGGRIEVTVQRRDGLAEIAVRDHGLGIPPEHREHIFTRFYQAHTESHRSGLGIGLALSREIVQLHEGTLHAEFPTDGGTRLVIRVASIEPPPDAVDSPSEILVVDDDVTIRELVVAALKDEGYQARTAANGAEALTLIRQWQPALILLDMRMPIMDGWEFARAYSKIPGAHAPIVVMTAAADASKRADEIGANGALGKPFDLSSLYTVVESYAAAAEGGSTSN